MACAVHVIGSGPGSDVEEELGDVLVRGPAEMKREALQKLTRKANEDGPGFDTVRPN